MTDGVGCTLKPSPRTVGEGFHALPAWDDGLPRCARIKWCAGGAREISFVGRWTRGGCDAGNAGAIGQATRLHLTRPGGHAKAGRRGRRPLRAEAKRRNPHRGKQMRKGGNPLPPLGSPERGAVTARSGVTEGLVQRRCGHTSVIRKPRPGGRGSPPLRGVGRWVRGTGVGGHPANGAPGTVRPTTRIVAFSNKPTSLVNQRKGRRGRRPLRGVRVGRCQRSHEVCG